MRTYTAEQLQQIIAKHRDYLRGVAGERADLSRADLSWANLSGASLSGANLSLANLSGANLSGASLSGANLSLANLSGANLSGANLSGASLSEASLSWANLSGANLSGASLSLANLSGANLLGAKWNDATKWPAITAILLASWGDVSDDLCRDLMRYDACNHPDPTAFDRWAKGGLCPYGGVNVGRAAHFTQRLDLWSPGPVKPYDIFQRLLAEKLVKV